MSVSERFALYCDMFNLIRNARDKSADWDALEQWRWQEKLALRRQAVEAFQRLDAIRGRAAQPDFD